MKKSKVPSGWINRILSEHSQIVSGGTPSTKNTEFWSGKIPWITSADIENVNAIKPKRYISESAIKNSTTNLIPKNNIVFVSRVGLGKVAINRFDLCISQDSQGIIFDKNIFDLIYLANYLSVLAQRFVHLNQGSAIKGILKEDLASLEILCPPLPEQKKIAEILSTWDQAIDTLDKLISAKTCLKKGLMQKLLTGKVRFKGFKEQWIDKQVKDLGKVVSGGTPDTGNPSYWDGSINWCTPTDITALNGRKYLRNTNRRITESGYQNSSATLLPKYSIVVCTRATLGECAINTEKMTTNQGFKSIIPKLIDYEYLYYLMLSKKYLFDRLGNGSTFLEVSKTDFENISVKIPANEAEQKKIAGILCAVDREIESLTNIQEKLKFQKQGLVQKLLTGKIRVSPAKNKDGAK